MPLCSQVSFQLTYMALGSVDSQGEKSLEPLLWRRNSCSAVEFHTRREIFPLGPFRGLSLPSDISPTCGWVVFTDGGLQINSHCLVALGNSSYHSLKHNDTSDKVKVFILQSCDGSQNL